MDNARYFHNSKGIAKTTLVLGLSLIIILAVQAGLIYYFNNLSKRIDRVISKLSASQEVSDLDVITTQTATIRGKVLKVEGSKLSVENERKIKGEVELGRIVVVTDKEKLKLASSSADFKSLKTDTNAVVSLTNLNGKYIVTGIDYP